MTRRRCTVEHPFGTIKAWMGSTHFLTRDPFDRFGGTRGGAPVGTGLEFDAVAVGVERNTVRGDGGIELGEGAEMPVGEGLIDMEIT